MTKEEFIDWLGIEADQKGLVEVTLDGVIAQAIAEHEQKVIDFIVMNGYVYIYKQSLARHGIDICLATTNPKIYCNGYFLYSDKDPGSGLEFVVIKTNDPNCELPTAYQREEGGRS